MSFGASEEELEVEDNRTFSQKLDAVKLQVKRALDYQSHRQNNLLSTLDLFGALLDVVLRDELDEHEEAIFSEAGFKCVVQTYRLLLKNRGFNSDQFEKVKELSRKCVDLSLKYLRKNNANVGYLLYDIFNADRQFYQDTNAFDERLRTPSEPLSQEEIDEDFFNGLHKGMMIDYYDVKWKRWKTGWLCAVYQNKFCFSCCMPTHDNTYDTLVKDPRHFAPCHSHFQDILEREPWRKELKKGSKVDLIDMVSKWYSAEVVETQLDGELLVVKFDSWTSAYNRKMLRTDPRIQEHGTISKGGREAVENWYFKCDSEEFKDKAAYYRPQTSPFLVDIVNYFEQVGGFDWILERLNQYDPIMPFEALHVLPCFLCKCCNVFSNSFAEKFIRAFKDAMFNSLLNMTDIEMRDLKPDWLERVKSHSPKLFSRTYTKEESWKLTEEFMLQMASKRLSSNVVERRINGMNYLTEICMSLRQIPAAYGHAQQQMPQPQWVDSTILADWLEQEKILDVIFNEKTTHIQLVKRSGDLFKLMIDELKFNKSHLDLIWVALERAMKLEDDVDDELSAIYKLLEEICRTLRTQAGNKELFDHLFDKIDSIPHQLIVTQTIDLLNLFTQNEQAAERPLSIMWSIMTEDKIEKDILTHGREKIEGVLKRLQFRKRRVEYMGKCVDCIAKHKSVPQCCYLLKELLTQIQQGSAYARANTPSCSDVIDMLNKEHGLMKEIFGDIASFKKESSATMSELTTEEERNECMINAFPYNEHIQCRLDLLSNVLGNSELKVAEDQADILWESLITNGESKMERQTALIWFKDAVMSLNPNSEFDILTIEVATSLFERHITKMDPSTIEHAAYDCLEMFFIFVNESNQVLKMYSEEEFKVLDFNKMVGVDLFWQIAFLVEDVDVKNSAIRFLNQLHSSFESEDVTLQESIQTEYLQRVMQQLQEGISSKNEERMDRCLDLIGKLLDMSEVDGLGDKLCHGAICKGHLIRISARNKCTYPGFEMKFYFPDNFTVWDLRSKMAQNGVRARDVRLYLDGEEVSPEKNAFTLKKMGLNDSTSVVATRIFRDGVPLANLNTGELVSDFRMILTQIFRRYSRDGGAQMMPLMGLQKYLYDCGGSEDSEEACKDMCRKWSQDDRHLTLPGFLKYYRHQVATGNSNNVRSDLCCMGWDENLEKQSDAEPPLEKEEVKERKLPRDLMSETPEYFDLLYEKGLKMSPRIAERVWDILLRNPTNQAKMKYLFSMDTINSTSDWKAFFSTLSPYQTEYCLMIFENLFNEDQAEDDDGGEGWAQAFLHNGGLEYFYHQLMEPDASDNRNVYLLTLRLTHNYLVSFFREGRDMRPFRDWGIGASRIVKQIQESFEGQIEKAGLPSYRGEDDEMKEAEAKESDDEVVKPPDEVKPISLKQEDKQSINGFLNYQNFADRLLKTMENISIDKNNLTSSDVVRLATELWILIISQQNQNQPAVAKIIEDKKQRILNILHSPNIKVQSTFCQGLGQLCMLSKVNNQMLNILLDELPGKTSENPQYHFKLVAALLLREVDKEHAKTDHFKPLFQHIRDKLLTLRSHETREECDQVLVGLLRILILLLMYYKDFRIEFAENIDTFFHEFLFSLGKDPEEIERGFPKCKHPESREACLNLLVQSCIDSPKNASNLFDIVVDVVQQVDTHFGWDMAPERNLREADGAGLYNLGSTCYMNSVLQQFYHMPKFRHGVLSCKSRIFPQNETLVHQITKIFSFLTKTEKQAVDMTEFTANYRDEAGQPVDVRIQQDAIEFLGAILNKTKGELKHSHFSNLIDQQFGAVGVTQMICQGGCNSSSEREQHLTSLQLIVKQKSGMQESLEAYVQSELLSDVQCDKCKAKTNKKRRDVLGNLPNTLVIHLKRFELNYETFRHEKVNSRWEFPFDLDLYDYTKEGLNRRDLLEQQEADPNVEVPEKYSEHPKEYYQYKLHGIIIHTGNAEAGHYYSFIRDRETGEWHEFNDHLVKPFDVDDVAEECFGGSVQIEDPDIKKGAWSPSFEMESEFTEQIKNAYILIYDRVKEFDYVEPKKSEDDEGKDPIPPDLEQVLKDMLRENLKIVLEHEPVKRAFGVADSDVLTNLKTEESMGGWVQTIIQQEEMIQCFKKHHESEEPVADNIMKDAIITKFVQMSHEAYPPAPEDPPLPADTPYIDLITEEVDDEILDDNKSFARERHVFNPIFFRFILNLFRIYKSDDDKKNLEIIQSSIGFCFETLARSGDKREGDIFLKYLSYIKTMLKQNPDASKWFLRTFCLKEVTRSARNITIYSLQCRNQLVIDGFCDLVVTVLKFLQQREEKRLDETSQQGFICASSNLMYKWFDEFGNAAKYWVRFRRFFGVIKGFCEMGPHQRVFCLKYRVLDKLTHLFLEQTSQQFNQLSHHRLTPPKWEYLLEVVVLLLRQCYLSQLPPKQADHCDLTFEPYDLLQRLDPSARMETLMKKLYRRVIENNYDNPDMTNTISIVKLLCWENQPFSHDVITYICKGVDAVGPEQVYIYMKLMKALVELDDTLYEDRIMKFHHPQSGVLHYIDYFKKAHAPFSFCCIEYLVEMMEEIPHYLATMKRDRAHWEWMDEWLHRHCNRYKGYHSRKLDVWRRYVLCVKEMGFHLDQQEDTGATQEYTVEDDSDDEIYGNDAV